MCLVGERWLHSGAIVLPGSSAGCLTAVGSAALRVTFFGELDHLAR